MKSNRCPARIAFVLPMSLVLAALSADGLACDGAARHTWHAWQRTWHGPNALETPLRGYFIPRGAAWCDNGVYAEACGEALDAGRACDHCPPQAGFAPVGFERLGQIPNDLELAVGIPAARTSGAGR